MLDTDFVSKVRIAILGFIVFVIYTLIAIRLWNIQVLKGEDTQEKVSAQYVRNIRLPAVRGRIITSDGVPVATNRARYDIVFHTSEMRRPNVRKNTVDFVYQCVLRVASDIGRKDVPDRSVFAEHIARQRGMPVTAFRDLSATELARASELIPLVPGMDIVCEPERVYPFGTFAGHLIGYVRYDDPASADDRKGYSYYFPDLVGKSGLEYFCDMYPQKTPDSPDGAPNTAAVSEKRPLLRGTPGKKVVIVDNRNYIRETLGPEIPAENGQDLVLTLDFHAQQTAENLIRGLSAAMIVMEADTGRIIVMASAPGYSPSDFVPKISQKKYSQLMNDPGRPLFNKALLGSYNPGSIIKPVMAMALLANGTDPYDPVYCDGYTPVGEARLNCWIRPVTGGGHGETDMFEALKVSCNDYFATNGLRLGVEKISEAFASAGIGKKTGFILPETSGRLPQRNLKNPWRAFDTALISIGQGEVLVSPLQAAVYVSAIANGGIRYRPLLVDRVIDPHGNVVFHVEPEEMGRLMLQGEQLSPVRDGMYQSVNAPMGGSRAAKNKNVTLYGKTGTAEMGPKNARYKNTWFAGFGESPKNGKKYAIIVFVEHGRSGGYTSAPLASAFFDEWEP